jgi:hypothetical protein
MSDAASSSRTPSSRTVLTWVVVAAGVVVGLSILVGFVGPRPGFQWELASLFGTALGTTLLAASTGALAYSTWSDVRATWQLADLTKRDQDERARPLVIQKNAYYSGGSGELGGRQEGRLTVVLLNVGLGPALKVEVLASYDDEDYAPTITPNPYIVPAIPPGEDVAFDMSVVFGASSPREGIRVDGFPLRRTYLDRSRRNEHPIVTDWSA